MMDRPMPSYEQSPLFDRREEETAILPRPNTELDQKRFNPYFILPVALLAALAMASTASTSFYATVAMTVSISNILGVLALGHLQKLSMTHNKRGLLLWMVTRSMSAVMLLLGVSTRSLIIALSGRIFEGLASDNLLHYILNTIYSKPKDRKTTSSLMGYSMALYLVGISVSPFLAGLFENFTISFFIALGLFALAILYLQVIVTSQKSHSLETPMRAGGLRELASTVIGPFRTLKSQPTSIFIGFSLFAYNVVQSYTFTALMVHTSTQFHFTGRENGLLLSIAHSVAAFYILLSLYAIPRMIQRFWPRKTDSASIQPQTRFATRDAILALVSQLIHIISLIGIGLSATAIQIYVSTAVLALSLPVPSFIKASFVVHLEGEDKSRRLASLAVMETMGSVLGPMVLGGWQSYSFVRATVFYVAAGIAVMSMVSFVIGIIIIKTEDQASNTP